MADSTPLGTQAKKDSPEIGLSMKSGIALLLIFMFVTSDVFIDSALPQCAMIGRDPTRFGIILQGIIVVVLFALVVQLEQHNIL
jgi:hypothetical protein